MPLSKEEHHTLAFLRMAAIELRRIAEEAPETRDRLLRIAEQLETETADIEQRGSRTPAPPA
jgi:hypothetical protein